MRRREFITRACGAMFLPVARPLGARAQQGTPVIGFLSARSPDESASLLAEFHRGLAEAGFAEGRNVKIEYRWAEGRNDRLPALAAELLDRGVAVVATVGGNVAALSAKSATTSVPIVFTAGGDPVKLGLVASLSRPGANVTGVTLLITELWAKRLELLKEVVPHGRKLAVLINPTYPTSVAEGREVAALAPSMGFDVHTAQAADAEGLERALANIACDRADALLVANDAYLITLRREIVEFAAKHQLPAVYYTREFVEAGGLVSYGSNIGIGYHAAAGYVGRILKGAKASDLPVLQPTRIDSSSTSRRPRAFG